MIIPINRSKNDAQELIDELQDAGIRFTETEV